LPDSGISEQSHCRRQREYGGLRVSPAKRLNAKLRDELINGEFFSTFKEAVIPIERSAPAL